MEDNRLKSHISQITRY